MTLSDLKDLRNRFRYSGKITDSIELVAFSERRAMVELVLKLKGYLVNKHELDAGPTLAELIEESFQPHAK